MTPGRDTGAERAVTIAADGVALQATLSVPEGASGAVAFAHGSGSGRHSPRNRKVAAELSRARLATLLMDLLSSEEERIDARTRALRFDIDLLGRRLVAALDWLAAHEPTRELPVGCFGASTGAAAALVAAARRPRRVRAIVSRGGRPDLAAAALPAVRAATLLIVGGEDSAVIELNRDALARLAAPEKRLEIVSGAGHLFEEPGALERVAALARDWFAAHV